MIRSSSSPLCLCNQLPLSYHQHHHSSDYITIIFHSVINTPDLFHCILFFHARSRVTAPRDNRASHLCFLILVFSFSFCFDNMWSAVQYTLSIPYNRNEVDFTYLTLVLYRMICSGFVYFSVYFFLASSNSHILIANVY